MEPSWSTRTIPAGSHKGWRWKWESNPMPWNPPRDGISGLQIRSKAYGHGPVALQRRRFMGAMPTMGRWEATGTEIIQSEPWVLRSLPRHHQETRPRRHQGMQRCMQSNVSRSHVPNHGPPERSRTSCPRHHASGARTAKTRMRRPASNPWPALARGTPPFASVASADILGPSPMHLRPP